MLKTIKEILDTERTKCMVYNVNVEKDLKAEAVKWIKEEIEISKSQGGIINLSIGRWMKRLDVTEEDLK